ncbi:MAG: dephospho-CoA kinase [Rhodospirillaceae bacterium]|nr:dephospho-CoA kinase [Rhodospirillaceae bacterium]|tara:strand:- start:239 stop:835 length:597 start_codon:yes stop_codon:yes gene_type:complete
MLIVGLTGSIATGKSTVSTMLRRLNFRVHDSDKAAHQLMGPGGSAVERILSRFGSEVGSLSSGINRTQLGNLVFFDPNKRCLLEQILHPLIHEQKERFIQHNRFQRKKVVFLDVPLLFETGGDHYCDRVITVWCPPTLQSIRALRRPDMTEKKLSSILEAQWPQPIKCFLSDLALPSSIGQAETLKRLKRWLRSENFI